MLRFYNGSICHKGKRLANTEVYVNTKTGKIVNEEEFQKGPELAAIDLKGKILAPGFIDVQNNGIYGVNFSVAETGNSDHPRQKETLFRERYRDAMKKYLSTGVTALCPTMTSTRKEVYQKMLPMYGTTRCRTMADSLGAHVEGPFLLNEKRGCHPEEALVECVDGSMMTDVYGKENLREHVAIVTVAPEVQGVIEKIPSLVGADRCVVSIGHTTLDSSIGKRAIELGASMITHLYNAMPQPHHRETGIIGLIGDSSLPQTPYYGLICDGIHVSPEMCVIAYRANPSKCILTTDAMHLFGLKDGVYLWDQKFIEKKGSRLTLYGTETLAGAATDLAHCVRNLMRWADISLEEAVATVTCNPAACLGLAEKGNLAEGCDADMVILNDEGDVLSVYKLGGLVEGTTRDSLL